MENEPRIIRKYSNRRLYDTGNSRYITLDELKNMVVNDESFRVVDSKTGDDITRATLLQALLSEESFEQPVLSERSLRNLVAFLHGPFRGPMAAYLEQCLPVFLESQRRLRSKFGDNLSSADLENIAALQGAMTRQTLEQYMLRGLENFLSAQQQMQDGMRQMMQGSTPSTPNIADLQKFFTPPGFPPPEEKK